MKKLVIFLVIVALGVTGYIYREKVQKFIENYSNSEELTEEVQKILREYPPKDVEVFQIGETSEKIAFSLGGETDSSTSVFVTPQINGTITGISVKVGDEVKKGETLVTLGESLNTDMLELQYDSAKKLLENALLSEQLTQMANQNAVYTTLLNIEMAKEAYKNTIQSKENTIDAYELQIKSTELGIESAEDAYDTAKDNYNNAVDALDDLEDQYDDLRDVLEPSDSTLKELLQTISQAETAVDNAKYAKKSADTGIEQAELGLEQLEESYDTQIDQLNYGIETSYLQYRVALSQIGTVLTSAQLQDLGIDSQIVQTTSSLQSAALTLEYTNVKSPIDGVITSITAEEGNLAAPGQALLIVENLDNLSIKTSINEKEASLIALGDTVTITTLSTEGKGEIISISPSLNEMSKKIDVEIALTDDLDLLKGSLVTVEFYPSSKDKIFIPLNSINISEDGKTVKIVDENSIVTCEEIETGQIIGDFIEITKGLDGDETIIKSVTTFIEDGETVNVTN